MELAPPPKRKLIYMEYGQLIFDAGVEKFSESFVREYETI